MQKEKTINLVTEIPGPKSRELVTRREEATPQGAAKLTPIAIARAEFLIFDINDGKFG